MPRRLPLTSFFFFLNSKEALIVSGTGQYRGCSLLIIVLYFNKRHFLACTSYITLVGTFVLLDNGSISISQNFWSCLGPRLKFAHLKICYIPVPVSQDQPIEPFNLVLWYNYRICLSQAVSYYNFLKDGFQERFEKVLNKKVRQITLQKVTKKRKGRYFHLYVLYCTLYCIVLHILVIFLYGTFALSLQMIS